MHVRILIAGPNCLFNKNNRLLEYLRLDARYYNAKMSADL